jgi:hypothetical protein
VRGRPPEPALAGALDARNQGGLLDQSSAKQRSNKLEVLDPQFRQAAG